MVPTLHVHHIPNQSEHLTFWIPENTGCTAKPIFALYPGAITVGCFHIYFPILIFSYLRTSVMSQLSLNPPSSAVNRIGAQIQIKFRKRCL